MSTTFNFEYERKIEYLIYGFIRENNISLQLSHRIPEGITKILVEYYPSPPLILEPGSCFTRIGFAGESKPVSIYPSIVGRMRHPGIMIGMSFKEYYVGDEASARKGILYNKYPIQHRVVSNWDDMVSNLSLYHHS